jgi:hydrogenase-4 component B
MPLELVLIALALLAFSGIPGLFSAKAASWGQRCAAILVLSGTAVGMTGAGLGLFSLPSPSLPFPWPTVENAIIGLDPLSSFFLMPIFLIGGLGSLYGLGYWKQRDHPRNARRLQLFWGLLMAGMGLLVVSRHAASFLLGWECMALSAFFLIATEDEDAECRKSALVYLIATHFSTLALFGFFILWRNATGSFLLLPMTEGTVKPVVLNVLFFLAFFGFGLKAGMMPMHFWLPGAHANAPSHVSAILSGVMLKMGVYGLIRIGFLLPAPPALWGGLILFAGAASGLLGVVFALAQHDLKRLLAYHSVENIGIILMGLGLALLGRSLEKPVWVALGMAGCLLHVWNHSLFKPLLFYGAGSVLHATGRRNLDVLGGLSKKLPLTALFFLIGAVAISGVPPLNGFISELFLYVGLMRPMAVGESFAFGVALAAPVLAMIGALAAACFVKAYAAVFLGMPRTEAIRPVREAPAAMLIPMGILAVLCAGIGVLPQLVSPILESVSNLEILSFLVPLRTLSLVSFGFLAGLAIISGWIYIRTKNHKAAGTWDCGYANPTSRMQYTASSFGGSLTGMFGWVLRPKEHKPVIKDILPAPAFLESHVDEVILDRLLIPAFHKVRAGFSWFNRFQQGQSQSYILYILIAVVVLLASLIPYGDWLQPIFVH